MLKHNEIRVFVLAVGLAFSTFLIASPSASAGSPEACRAFVKVTKTSYAEEGVQTGTPDMDQVHERAYKAFLSSLAASCDSTSDSFARQLKLMQSCQQNCTAPTKGDPKLSASQLWSICNSECNGVMASFKGFERGFDISQEFCKPTPSKTSASANGQRDSATKK